MKVKGEQAIYIYIMSWQLSRNCMLVVIAQKNKMRADALNYIFDCHIDYLEPLGSSMPGPVFAAPAAAVLLASSSCAALFQPQNNSELGTGAWAGWG